MKKKLLKLHYAWLCVMVLFLFSLSVNAQDQMLLGWQFFNSNDGGKSKGDEITYNSTTNGDAIQQSTLSRGAGLNTYAYASGALFGAVPKILTPDSVTAINGNAYYEFNVNIKDNYAASLSGLNYKIRMSGTWSLNTNATPLYFIWKYSTDNGITFTSLGTKVSMGTTVITKQPTVPLSDVSDLQNLAPNSKVIFRLYVWGFTFKVGNGTFSFGTSTSADDVALSLSGTSRFLGDISTDITETYFTDQKAVAKSEASEVIMDKLISYINNTPAGENIHVSIYMISHQGVMDALKAAEKRGVNLHIIVDMSRSDSQIANANSLPWLQVNLPNSEIITSVNDVSSNAINHHKFALFSKVYFVEGVAKNITFQTSHNFTVSDTKKIQDALIFNDAGIYQAYLANWNIIKNLASSGMAANYQYNFYEDAVKGIRLEFFPKIGVGVNTNEDNLVESLNAISDVSSAKVRVAMSDWSDSRIAIVNKLIALRNQGATIEVYAKDAAGTQIKAKLKELETLGATVRIFNLEAGSAAKFNIHAKMMLIEGTFKGQANAKVIITGSHNYTDAALKTNNEVLLTLTNSPLFLDYNQYFEKLKVVVPAIPVFQLNLKSIDLTSGNNSNVTTFNSTAAVGGIVNAFVSRGAGLKGSTGLTECYNSSHIYAYTDVIRSTFADAFERDEYLQVQFETKNSVKASLNKIEWILRKSSLTVPTHYRWYYSVNSTKKEDFIAVGTDDLLFIHNTTAAAQEEIDLSNIPALQNIGANTTVYLRLYVAGAINTTSSFGFRNFNGEPGFNLLGDVDQDLSENLLAWDLSTSNNGARADGNEVSINSNITKSSLNVSSLKRGAGLNADPAYNVTLQRGFTAVSSNVVTTLEEAVSYGNYFSFDVSPKENVLVSLKALHVNIRRSTTGGNRYLWRYKINDGEFVDLTNEVTFTSTNTNGVYQPIVNLANIPALQNVKADSIVFRLYSWGYNNINSGTFSIGRSTDSYDFALQLQGTSLLTDNLPVSLAKFEAVKTNNAVKLSWQTASETNNSHFNILKSVDGVNWSLLTTVAGNGNSNKLINYNTLDINPFSGINYYQLKQVDFDGKVTLSKIVSVNYAVTAKETLAVNYSNNTLTLFVNKNLAEQAEISLLDLSGKKIISKKVQVNNGESAITIPANLNNGIYVVRLQSLSAVLTTKFSAN